MHIKPSNNFCKSVVIWLFPIYKNLFDAVCLSCNTLQKYAFPSGSFLDVGKPPLVGLKVQHCFFGTISVLAQKRQSQIASAQEGNLNHTLRTVESLKCNVRNQRVAVVQLATEYILRLKKFCCPSCRKASQNVREHFTFLFPNMSEYEPSHSENLKLQNRVWFFRLFLEDFSSHLRSGKIAISVTKTFATLPGDQP